MDRGMGRGRCTKMGTGFEMGNWPVVNEPASPSESDVDPAQVQAFLKDQAQILEQQSHQIEQRIRQLETGHKLVAVVLSEKCAGCGICTDVCTVNAIEINGHAVVNTEDCTGCGNCVTECPNEAVILTSVKYS
jgi:NAD-dependent dihydropyrimidine dehydrogenase PreA subunit